MLSYLVITYSVLQFVTANVINIQYVISMLENLWSMASIKFACSGLKTSKGFVLLFARAINVNVYKFEDISYNYTFQNIFDNAEKFFSHPRKSFLKIAALGAPSINPTPTKLHIAKIFLHLTIYSM